MADSAFWWGVARTYRYGAAVAETSWERVGEQKKQRIDKKLSALAQKILKKQKKIKPTLKTKLFFSVMRQMQKHGWNEADMNYWKGKGWTENERPWK